MNAEGWGVVVSSEWVQAIATGFLMLALALFVVVAQGTLWRRHVWRNAPVAAVAEALGGRIVPIYAGWKVVGRAGTVEFSGGLQGLRTEIEAGGRRVGCDGLLGRDEALGELAALTPASSPSP